MVSQKGERLYIMRYYMSKNLIACKTKSVPTACPQLSSGNKADGANRLATISKFDVSWKRKLIHYLTQNIIIKSFNRTH
jgi:hypothetical protein